MRMKGYGRLIGVAVAAVLASAATRASGGQDAASKIKQGISRGKICYKLTEPEEFKAIVGAPLEEKQRASGGMLVLEWSYQESTVYFGKFKNQDSPFTLLRIVSKGTALDIGENRKIVLRNGGDLKKLDKFEGLQNVSLVKLDLKNQGDFLASMGFDSLTEWPAAEKLPRNFDPAGLLRIHATPGLGVGDLHKRGIDGRGVGVAIIDQPLRLGHKEYTSKILRYDARGLGGMSPQMHGSPVASILVGQTVGVAPGAALTYFAVPMWARDNLPYVEALRRIFDWNKTLPLPEKIRAVSLSTGSFSKNPHFEEWRAALEEADRLGILVVCCDPAMLKYGILACESGRNPDDAGNYKPSYYTTDDDVLRIPGAGRTLASHRGDEVYMFDREGGMSWGAPYIVGLAALACQIVPDIAPNTIIRLLVDTATRTNAGPVVNPRGFIEAVEKEKKIP